MIVIDVGCATWGGDNSVGPLIDEFSPILLIGLDPAIERFSEFTLDGCVVSLYPTAAWTSNGPIGFTVANLGGHIDHESEVMFEGLDLAERVLSLPSTQEIVLKIDAEGAEYDLVPHLVSRDADLRLKLMLVEWHCSACGYGIWDGVHPDGCTADQEAWLQRRETTKQGVRCELKEWNR